jgi:hypothetical protein
MLKFVATTGLVLVLSAALGCDHGERIGRLEKQNEELKAELKKNQAAADLDLQAKCSKDARAWLKENYSGGGNTILFDFTNHYNKALNKCFSLEERHYRVDKKWLVGKRYAALGCL